MTTPQAFRDLATVIEGFDAAEISVDGVRTDRERSADEASLTAELTARIPRNANAGPGGTVSFALPDGTDVVANDRELAVPLRVEITADGAESGDAGDARSGESADAAKTRITDGGVRAPVKTDGAAPSATDRSNDRTTEPRDDSRNEVAEDAPAETESAPAEPENAAAESTDEGGSADDEPATPPHRDPERLREVYESRETFAEMTEALGASVTPQAVRNQMIRRGIHEPNRRDSSADDEGEPTEGGASDGESESRTAGEGTDSQPNEETTETGDPDDDRSASNAARPEPSDDPEREERTERDERADRGAAAADGEEPTEIDLPSHVTLDDVGAAVAEATTLYEVQRALRTDRTKTRKLLRQLDLLELVTGRVATADDRRGAAEEIDERIRRADA